MWTPPAKIKHPLPQVTWPTMEQSQAALLFQPLRYQALQLQQRTWVPAMVPWRAHPQGYVSEDVMRWYQRFAQGQPGAIVIEATGVRDIESGPLLRIGHDRFIPGLSQLTQAMRQSSQGKTLNLVQLIDFLPIRRRPSSDKFFAKYLPVNQSIRMHLSEKSGDVFWLTLSESDVRTRLAQAHDEIWQKLLPARLYRDLSYGYREEINDMHIPAIRDLPQQLPPLFTQAALRAQQAGFDGIELHFAHAYTLASFLSRSNMRDDGYGGSREQRVRLPLEVYQAVRASVGDDFIVGCRFLGEDVIQGGSTLEDTREYALAFAQAGFDFLSLSKGGRFEDAAQPKVGAAAYPYTGPSGYECMPTVYSDQQGPFGRNVYLSQDIRSYIRQNGFHTPVVIAGGIQNFEQAESILQSQQADIIAAARQSLADPDWFLKMHLGLGEQIRRCQYTNYCEALDARHKQVTCRLWDRTLLDADDAFLSHDKRRRLEAPQSQLPSMLPSDI